MAVYEDDDETIASSALDDTDDDSSWESSEEEAEEGFFSGGRHEQEQEAHAGDGGGSVAVTVEGLCMRGKAPNHISTYRGVYWSHGRWVAQITTNGNQVIKAVSRHL